MKSPTPSSKPRPKVSPRAEIFLALGGMKFTMEHPAAEQTEQPKSACADIVFRGETYRTGYGSEKN